MTWSAGQREFVPLLMGLYWLLPASKVSRRDAIKWVVLEEIEAGLHPSAISAVLLVVLDLLSRGYRVCLSTHSPHVLDVVWAIRTLQSHGGDVDLLLDVFSAPRNAQTRPVAEAAMGKDYRVYYFEAATGLTHDISTLDPASTDGVEAGWGGLTEFSGRVADVVAGAISRALP